MTLSTEQVKKRLEIPEGDRWNVEALFSTYEAWEKALNTIYESKTPPHWPRLAAFRGRLKESPSLLHELLTLSLSYAREIEKLYTYAHLRHDEEITDDTNKGAYQRALTAVYAFQQESSWIEPELLALPDDVIKGYLQAPELEEFRFHIEKIIRLRPHTLSADKEELLAMAGRPLQTAPKAFSALNNADIKLGHVTDCEGKEHPLTHGLYQLYLRAADRTLRENAYKTMHANFSGLENTMGELLSGQIENHIFQARARHYSSSLEASLFPKKIPQSVYRSLIAAVRNGLPSLHRYVAARKKILNLPEIHLYDMYTPLVPHIEMEMSYPEAEKQVIESVAPLGEVYQSTLRTGMQEQRWVDRYENKNKRSGAYSSGCYDSYPYILMNFKGILRDTFTLAHEAGHSMHSYLSKNAQPYHYASYPIFVAEVASTFNEELLMHHLLSGTEDRERRLFLVNEKIEDIRATLFRQTMFAEFELKIHELAEAGTPLTPALLKEIFLQLNKDYFGPEATIDPEGAIEWARIPHFYYNFYVYQYATGMSAALNLAEKVLSGDTTTRDNYLSFLQGGCSLFPIDLLKLAGVDMTTTAPVEAAIRTFDGLVSELETIST